MRFFLTVIASLHLWGSSPADSFKPEYFWNGTVDLASAFAQKGLPDANEMRRGDSPFDNLKLTLYGDVIVHPRLQILNQIILSPASRASIPSFLRTYVRVQVTESRVRSLGFEAGKIPTPFGGYGGRGHSDVNPLISTPLMYHYFTSLRSNQLPSDAQDLLAHRGEGPSARFSGYAGGGSSSNFNGMPLIYDSCWDFGVRALGSVWRFEYSLAVTQGTLGNPVNSGGDNNDGKQVVAHVDFVPGSSLIVGASYASGAYLDRVVSNALPAGKEAEDYAQSIWGVNVELSYGHLNLLGEIVRNTWTSPFVVDSSGRLSDLQSIGWYLEGRYAMSPGLFLASRVEGIKFGNISDGAGGTAAWDDDVGRVEGGVGYYLTDRTIGKLIVQYVDKKGSRGFREAFPAAQLSLTF